MSTVKPEPSSAPLEFPAQQLSVRQLPARPHLEHLKKQAKDLLQRGRNGDATARARFEAVERAPAGRAFDQRLLTLASAQHLIAQSYGFATWSALKDEVLRRAAERLREEGLPADRARRMTLLEEALREHDLDAARVLLELDPALANGWDDNRPLGLAAELDSPALVDLLLDAGAALEPPWSYPHSPLSWAVTNGALGGARRLAERGARLDLWGAAGLGDVQRLQSFFDAQGKPVPGASRHGVTRFDQNGHVLPKPPSAPKDQLSDALYIACRNGQLEAARFLLDRGADPKFRAYDGAPALHWAAYSGNRALVELLLARGADAEQAGGQFASRYRQFAVRTPIEWGQLEALKRAISADPTLLHERDASWGPPLHSAALQGLDDHVRFLLEAGADPRALDHAGRSALACARLAQGETAPRVVALLEAAGAVD